MPQAGLSHCAWTHRLRVCSVCCTVPWREDRHSVERAGLPAPSRKMCAPSQPATSATGLDSPLLHLHRDWELCSHPSSPRLRSLLLSLPPGWHSCMPSRGMRNGTGPSPCKVLIVLKIAASACRRSARRAAASSQASSKRIVTASSSAPLHKADSQQVKHGKGTASSVCAQLQTRIQRAASVAAERTDGLLKALSPIPASCSRGCSRHDVVFKLWLPVSRASRTRRPSRLGFKFGCQYL